MFGINVVESLHEQQSHEDNARRADNNLPEYNPPFTVGEGEGFGNVQTEENKPEEQVIYKETIDLESPEFFDDDGNIFKGPFHIPRLYMIMAVLDEDGKIDRYAD